MICPTGKAKNFSKRDWTGQIRLKRFNKFSFARKCPGVWFPERQLSQPIYRLELGFQPILSGHEFGVVDGRPLDTIYP